MYTNVPDRNSPSPDGPPIVEDVARLTPLAAIDRIVSGGYGEWMDKNDVPTRRIDLLRHIAAREESVASFLDRIDQLDAVCKGEMPHPNSEGLSLMTAHASKGREFDTVVILDAVDGTFPSSQMNPWNRSKDANNDYQEERRLFYVSMTRAKDDLILMRPTSEETPFVDEIVPRSKPEVPTW